MKGLENKIFVRVDAAQKDFLGELQRALDFETNHRVRNPVICECLENKGFLQRGDKILAHHNFFREDSPFWVSDDVFSIKINPNIFARLDTDGNAHSLFGNIICERLPIEYELDRPIDTYSMSRCIVRVVSSWGEFRAGRKIIITPYSDYEIVYNWLGEERRVIKVNENEVVGKIL